MSSSEPRVAVVGGGVIGVSTARHLARLGGDVTLVTEGRLGSVASGRSLSWLNSAGRYPDYYHQLRLRGIERYRELLAAHGRLDWLRFDGGLHWRSPEEAPQLVEQHHFQRGRGYESVLLSPAEVARQVPGVDPAAVPGTGAIHNPGDGWVDLPSLIELLVTELLDAGGRVLTDAGPSEVQLQAGRVAHVSTARGDRLAVDATLLATGSDVPRAAATFGVSIPDATSLALLVRTEPARSGLKAVLNTPRVALRPTPDGGLAVDSDWPTPHIVAGDDATYTVAPEVVDELLTEASRVLAGHPVLTPRSCGIGTKPVPGDGEPVLGPLGDIEGLHVAFTHSGATLALVVGELLAAEITSGQPEPLLAPFRAARFS